jgi:YihY family inner membrane protein
VNGHLDRAVTVTRGVANGAQSDRITFIAASLAYYAFISLLPLVLLALVAASLLGDTGTVDALVAAAAETLGEQAGSLVQDAITGAAGRGGATLLGVAVLLWSGLKLFRGLDIAFSEVYGAPGPEGLVDQIRNGVVALGAVALGVAGTVAVGAAIAVVGVGDIPAGGPFVGALGTLALIVGLTVAFLPLYYVLPGADVGVREALPGAVFAAIGWAALQTGFRIYAANAGSYEAYGVLGGVLLLVTFLYFGALVLLLGVVLNAVLAGRADEETGLAEPADDPEPEPTAILDGIMTRDRIDDDVSPDPEAIAAAEEAAEANEAVRSLREDGLDDAVNMYCRQQKRRTSNLGWSDATNPPTAPKLLLKVPATKSTVLSTPSTLSSVSNSPPTSAASSRPSS